MDSPAPGGARRILELPSPESRTAARAAHAVALAGVLLMAGGCASQGGVGGMVGKTLEAVGLKGQAPREQAVPLRLYAGDNLNAGKDKRGLALVVRVYQLRGAQRFEQAPFEAFLDEASEKAALGDDLIKATEILLMPGQRHELAETVAAEGSHLGAVALFRAPVANRWRFVFDARKAAKDGITLGLHACAMTTTSPALITALASPPHSLSAVNCAGKR
ncbi:type VI secretion system lipoprotein TssJ [Lysobacter koreensis]|uniref:Type VI secretion system lipoprotein TssJ n=1 Tax=Lysobacter koreensis TaxID=266122 RepID=A0ABW2YTK9_9GAMM